MATIRYLCVGCKRAFTRYPQGADRSEHSASLRALMSLIWALGLSHRSAGSVLTALGCLAARMGGRRAVQRMYEVGGGDESAFSRLLHRLPGADRYKTDAYPVYEWLPRDRHVIGKGGAVNWNEGLHSKLRSKLNRLVRRTKGYTKSVEMLKHLPAIALDERLNQSLKSISATH